MQARGKKPGKEDLKILEEGYNWSGMVPEEE